MRHLVIIVLLFSGSFTLKSQTLQSVSDSVFQALRYKEFDSLKKFFPTYKELKATLDSMDIDKDAPQVMISQKQGEYALRRSFKTFIKQADKMDFVLPKMEMEDMRHPVQNLDGKKYSMVEVDCRYKKKGATISFTMIELNNVWYLGEDIKITERELEVEPDYEKIDKAAEERKEKREKDRIKATEKAQKDSVKADKNRKAEAAKKEKEEAKKKREEEKAKKKADLEADKKRKQEELEKKKLDKQKKTAPKDSLPK